MSRFGAPRYLRQMKGGERVAAVKISAAQTPPKNFGIRNRIEPHGCCGGIAAKIGIKRWCGANPDGCYGGIAAKIGTKNMPLAYFLNAPTPAYFLTR